MSGRHTKILELLRDQQRVSVRDLAERFSVSEMTIRRDLTALQEQGFLMRTHGGGVAAARWQGRVDRTLTHHAAPSPAKVAIGRLGASLVRPGQTAMMDCGTTTLEVARHLPDDPRITVATVSLTVAQELFGSSRNVLMLGGMLRREFFGVYGPFTEAALNGLHADLLFIGCDGADSAEGFYAADTLTASLERAMMRIATRVVMVAESVKFGRRALIRFALASEVHIVITDSALDAGDRARLEASGVQVLIANHRDHPNPQSRSAPSV